MARKKSKPVTLPPFAWETVGNTGTRDAKGAPVRARLARRPVEPASIETKAVDPETGDDATTRAPVWRGKVAAAVAALPKADRTALADYADLVARVGASAGTLDPSGGGGSRPTPTGPSLAHLTAAESLAAVHRALAGRFVETGAEPPRMTYRRLVELLAIEEISPKEIARRVGCTATGRPSRPAVAAVSAAIPVAAARVAVALGHRRG